MSDTVPCSLGRDLLTRCFLFGMASLLLGPVSSPAQNGALGTSAAGYNAATPPISLGKASINPFKSYQNASYGTGGVALRNRGRGVLQVSGVTGPVQDAYLYWAILFNTPTPDRSFSKAALRPISFPLQDLEEVTLEGTLLGIGTDPCWGSTGIAVFRARVPRWVARGNGAYEVILARGASGRTDGSDPWLTPTVFPLAEGASLVIVGTGAYSVGIYDVPFSAQTFGTSGPATFDYSLTLPGTLTQETGDALWDNIGADGQTGGGFGGGREDDPASSAKTTTIDGNLIAGATGSDNDADWNGSAGLPIPKLWDDTGHDIFPALFTRSVSPSPDFISSVDISFETGGDCLSMVANVLAVR